MLANGAGCGRLLLVQPSGAARAKLDTARLEEFCADEFLVTYEVREGMSARTAQVSRQVTAVSTNPCYQSVTGYPMRSGGFFTAAAWHSGSRHAVLNVQAASDLFGSVDIVGAELRLDREVWTVTGVLDDGEEKANLYLPASVTGARPDSLLVLLDGGTSRVSEEYAATALKALNISASGYDFVSLAGVTTAFTGRFRVAWMAAAMLALLLAGVYGGGWLARRLSAVRAALRDAYLRELVTRNPAGFAAMTAVALLLACGVAAFLALSLRVLALTLGWGALPTARAVALVTLFPTRVQALAGLMLPGAAAFWAFFPALLPPVILFWRWRPHET